MTNVRTRRHRHDTPEWGDEVVRRYLRRKYREQQREKAMADLRAAIENDLVLPILRALRLL